MDKLVTSASSYTKDKLVLSLSVIGVVLTILNIIQVFVRLRSSDFKVPVQNIVNDGTVLRSAEWFSVYTIVLFGVLGAASTIFLAKKIYPSNRLFAAAILAVYVVVATVTLLVSFALLGLIGRV